MMLTSWKEIASHLNCAVRMRKDGNDMDCLSGDQFRVVGGMLPLIPKCLTHGSATVFQAQK